MKERYCKKCKEYYVVGEICPKCKTKFRIREIGDEKEEINGIGGWLAFFIFTLFISIIINFIAGIEDVFSVLFDPEILISTKIWLGTLDVLLFVGIISFAVYTIYSFIKLKQNAVSLGKMYLVLLFLTNILAIIFSSLAGIPLAGETSYFDSTSIIFRSLVYSGIWFAYLSWSKRVKTTFPIYHRKTYTIDKILFFGILAIPIAIYLLTLVTLSYSREGSVSKDTTNLIANPLKEEQVKYEPYNEFYKEILKPDYTWYLPIEFKDYPYDIKVDFDIKADRGIDVYFLKSEIDWNIYNQRTDRADEKFSFYEGCKSLGKSSFKGTCVIKNGAGLMVASKGEYTTFTLNLTLW